MAVRIQIRRDTSANWTSNNPVLYPGEIGFETDTKKFKIGPAVSAPTVATAWNSITAYANVVPSDLSNTLNDYILAADLGVADGPAKLNVDGNLLIPEDSIIFEGATANDFETTLTVTDPTADRTITLPDVTGTVVTTGDTGSVTNTMLAGSIANNKLTNSSITINGFPISLGGEATYSSDNIQEGTTNKYFSAELAQDAVAQALANGTHTNITVSYNDNSNAISLTGAQTYSDENAQDAIGNALGTGLSYNDTTGAISVDTTTIQARVADVSDTEIGYLNGVTSAIQTQIDGKLASTTAASTYAPINNPTFTGTVTLPGNPSTANEAATKSYVDNISAGLNFHAAVHAATTADLSATYDNSAKTLSASGAFPQIDGHTINETERVLVKSQSNAVQNGIYTLTDDGDPSGTWVLTRASDADNTPAGEIAYGDFTFVQNGTANGGQGFIMTTTGTITLGSSNIVYTQFNTGQAVVAGNGLSETTPGTLSINTAITADLSTAQTLTNKTITGTFTGNLTGDVSGNSGTVTNGVYTNAANTFTVSPQQININNAANGGLTIKAAASQTAPLQQWQNSSSTLLAQVSATGRIYSSVSITAGAISTTLGTLTSVATSAAIIGAVVRGAASQTADLQQWQNSSATVLAKIDATGNITAPSLTLSTTALSPTSGGTGLASYASGDILYASATDTLAKLTAGTNGQILTLSGGLPVWAAAPITYSAPTIGSTSIASGSTVTSIAGLTLNATSTTSITANTATTVDTNALSAFTTVKYIVSIKQGSKVRSSEIIAHTDGSSVDYAEFGVVETGGPMNGILVAASVSSTNCILQVTITNAASTNATVKIQKVLI